VEKRLGMSLVSLVRARHSSDFRTDIEKSLNLIEFDFGQDVERVAIKPNMCYYWDYSIGETTNPQFVACLIDVLREHISPDLEVRIVESDASSMKCDLAFKMLGYEKMAKQKKVKLVNLSKDEKKEVKVETSNSSYRLSIPDTMENADLFINVPKIKYMIGTLISCALKNIFGCNPYPKKFEYHSTLDEVIVSLNKTMRPDLCVVDGIIVRGKSTRKLGLIMASTDPVAMDSAAARIAGLNPEKIRHIVLAEKEGVGRMQYRTIGEDISYFAERFPRIPPRDRIVSTVIDFGILAYRKIERSRGSSV